VASYNSMHSTNDEDLVSGILSNDEASVLKFVQCYQDRVYRQAYRMLGNSQDTEDVCQEIFLKALRNMKLFEGRCKLSTWLYQIVHTSCLDVLKKRKRRPADVEIDDYIAPSWVDLNDAVENIELKEQRAAIDAALSQLSPRDANLIELYHLQDMSLKEISEITEMTVGSIKVRLLRARKKLAVLIQKSMPIDSLISGL
jgi:RNA polymerase sigma factor (sigma-70 family)